MITISIASNARAEGKTYTAIRLLMAHSDMYLLVSGDRQRDLIFSKYHLPPSQARRVITSMRELEGKDAKVLIKDLT